MTAITVLAIYFVIMFIALGIEVYLLFYTKGPYLKTSYKALENLCKSCIEKNVDILSKEVNRFYEQYVQEDAQTKKFFPNVVVWLDAIIFRIDCGYKHAIVLKDYEDSLKSIRDELETQNPFNKCEKYQQDILYDIYKIASKENEIVVQNIIKRTEEEFVRLSTDIKKNKRSNNVSITIGIAGIIVSIVMAFISF